MDVEEFYLPIVLGVLILMGSVGYMLYTEHVANFGCGSYHCK